MLVTLSRRAREDLRKIFMHLALHVSCSQADRMIDRIEARCQTLVSMPERGPRIGPVHLGLRHLIERPYAIVYDVAGEQVTIIAVLHGARDIEAELRDLFDGSRA